MVLFISLFVKTPDYKKILYYFATALVSYDFKHLAF